MIATPSYGIHLAEVAEDDGINPKDMNLKAIGFGAEMWSEEIRQKLEKSLWSTCIQHLRIN